ncbi:hypothetical protein [Tatumella ptyseos]|uniref:hypothetical protein n=1 Tax=Tatumella ptyseos TaxID=82987 RepID=UPI0023F3E83C|nr:hypothetical protein [Tatumella ptyseos]
MSDTLNPKQNKYVAAHQIVLEMIRSGKIRGNSADEQAHEISSLYRYLLDAYDETHNR